MKPTHRTPYILAAVILIVTGVFALTRMQQSEFSATGTSTTPTLSEEVHYHAAFRIYEGSEPLDFTAFEYMSVKPCGPDEEDNNEHETEAIEDFVHLHDLVGDVIHIHGPGATWADVFEYVKMTDTLEVTGYNFDTLIENALNSPVEPYQSMTFFIGKEPTETVKQEILNSTPEKEYIQEIEKKSEACSS